MRYILTILLLLSVIYPKRQIMDYHKGITLSTRPVLPDSILSPSGHFMIHYNNNYYNGIEDYADSVGFVADYCRAMIIDTLGFKPEIDDNDGIYDIYIMQLQPGNYGRNWEDPEGSPSGSSFITIDDDYALGSYYTEGINTMKITIAHEFFHAIQRAYLESDGYNSFFFELSSVWIEDVIFPNVNDYILFGPAAGDYFDNPEINIDQCNGYGLGLYGHYLNYSFGSNTMHEIWDTLSTINTNYNNYILDAIDLVLIGNNSSFIQTWVDFNSKNLFNGIFNSMNNDIYYYIDQIDFIPIDSNPISIENRNSIDKSVNLDNKSVSIESFQTQNEFYFQISHSSEFDTGNNDDNGNFDYGLISIVSDNRFIDELTNDYTTMSLKEGDIFHLLYSSKESHEIDFSIIPICTAIDDGLCSDILITPNPINYKGSFNITINPELEITRISIDIYDIRGRFINNLFNGNINNILNSSINFDDLLSSGVYILVFNIDEEQKMYKKITYLK